MKSSRGNAAEESTAQLGWMMASCTQWAAEKKKEKRSHRMRCERHASRSTESKKDHRFLYLSRNMKQYNLCKMVFFIIFGMRMACALHFISQLVVHFLLYSFIAIRWFMIHEDGRKKKTPFFWSSHVFGKERSADSSDDQRRSPALKQIAREKWIFWGPNNFSRIYKCVVSLFLPFNLKMFYNSGSISIQA